MRLRNDQPDGTLQPAAELIFGDWYPALRSGELRKGRMETALLLGVPLVLGRKNDGALFALRDLCPHRGIPLSAGWFDGETVQCRYHGWRFEPCGGQCTEIPSLTQIDTLQPTKIYAGAYPCRERDGYAWVYLPTAGMGRVTEATVLPPVPEVPKFGEVFRSAHLQAELPCNVDHGIIGLMDPAHGPFVHRSWWWRSAASIHEKSKRFEPLPEGFRMTAHAPSANSAPYKLLGVYGEKIETTIDFVLPNRRFETIRAGAKWFASLTTSNAGDGDDVPHRCGGGVEHFLPCAAGAADCEVLRRAVCGAGPGDDGAASGGAAVPAGDDADRRRGQAGEVVLCVEAAAVDGGWGASAARAGGVALAKLT